MRELEVLVPKGNSQKVIEIAQPYEPSNLVQLEAQRNDRLWDLIILYVSNNEVSPLINDLNTLDDLYITLRPLEVYPITPTTSGFSKQITDVTPRSPIEIWLNGLQSIGSWKSFIAYTLAASIVVWVGMFNNTIFLLVAAMLIAPFAGPALNVALASATGDISMLKRSLLRYFISLLVLIAATGVLSLLLRQTAPTSTMVQISEISSVAVLLPLVAGGAGALTQIQASNNSLVSGTAPGLLVAASLAPPAALAGMAGALGRWDMAFNGVFVLLLQLLGINLAGALVFRLYKLQPSVSKRERGQSRIFNLSIAATILLMGGMLAYQFSSTPALQRSTRSQRAVGVVQQVVRDSDMATLVEANLRFTRPSSGSQETLLGIIYVLRNENVALSSEEIRRSLTDAIEREFSAQGFNVVPVLDVNVLDPPAE